MISNRLWEILVTFHECGTLCAAAEKLYVSQPSLTAAMKELEKELGVTLFERKKNRISFNAVGQEAVRLARDYLLQDDAIVQQLQEMSRRLRTITVASFVTGLREQLVEHLMRLYPDRTIAAEHISTELLPLGLLQGRYDYVITEHPIEEPGVVCVPYVTERLMVRLHNTDALAQRKQLTFEDLRGSKLLVWMNGGFWAHFIEKQLGEKVRLVFVNDKREYRDLLNAFPMRSFALNTTADDWLVPADYCHVPLAEEGVEVTFYLCCLQKNVKTLQGLVHSKTAALL